MVGVVSLLILFQPATQLSGGGAEELFSISGEGIEYCTFPVEDQDCLNVVRKLAAPHTLEKKHFSRPTFCNYCSGTLCFCD